MICFYKSDLYSVGVRYDRWSVHRKRSDPFLVYRKHVDDEICSALRTIYESRFPAGRKISVVI